MTVIIYSNSRFFTLKPLVELCLWKLRKRDSTWKKWRQSWTFHLTFPIAQPTLKIKSEKQNNRHYLVELSFFRCETIGWVIPLKIEEFAPKMKSKMTIFWGFQKSSENLQNHSKMPQNMFLECSGARGNTFEKFLKNFKKTRFSSYLTSSSGGWP